MTTEKLIADLEKLIEGSRHIPFTTKRLIDEEEIMTILDAIHDSLPMEMEESRRILKEKDKILADAQKQGESLVKQGKEYIAALTEEHELVKAAQERANEVMMLANKSSEELKNSSAQYAIDMMKYVEGNLEKSLEGLRQTRESIRSSQN